MTQRIPLRDAARLGLSLAGSDAWIEQTAWIPVSTSEYHLASRHFAFAMRLENQRPELGLLVNAQHLARPLLDQSRKWCGIYRPMALRCFPLEAREFTGNALTDITIPAGSDHLSPSAGIPLVDENGGPSKPIAEIYRLLGLLQRSREVFAEALDQYLIADLLVPLGRAADCPDLLYVLDRNRLKQMGNAAFGAMARHGFLSVDLAVAWAFSLQNLRPECLADSSDRAQRLLTATLTPVAEPVSILMDELALVLDDGELVALGGVATDEEHSRSTVTALV